MTANGFREVGRHVGGISPTGRATALLALGRGTDAYLVWPDLS